MKHLSQVTNALFSSMFWGSLVLLISGTAFLYYQRTQPTILSFDVPPPVLIETNDAAVPIRITIPSLAIDIPVEPGYITNNVWSISDHYVNHLSTSARPGSDGNIIMYGHNSRSILGNLTTIQEGARIILTDDEQTDHTYTVISIYTVTPDIVDPVQQTDEEVLTLYTCTGFLNSKRFIVRAEPLL